MALIRISIKKIDTISSWAYYKNTKPVLYASNFPFVSTACFVKAFCLSKENVIFSVVIYFLTTCWRKKETIRTVTCVMRFDLDIFFQAADNDSTQIKRHSVV